MFLVAGSAITWSFGGTIARFITLDDPWTIVFWRSAFAVAFLILFMLLRDGPRGTLALFRNMGLAGIAVGVCFAIASTSFIVALQHTTVANILLMQAGVPLIAALLAWALFGERVSLPTWAAIAAVIAGVAIMVSASFTGEVSPLGDGLALLISVMFSIATVITRRAHTVRMTPAVCLGTILAAIASGLLASGYSASAENFAWLFGFGAINLGMGLAMFATGARLIPSAVAALVGTLEPVLGPIWVWLIHGEVPGDRTIIGGTIVFLALFIHLLTDFWRQRQRSG
ncbi:MAG: DMT family transporter [Aestuariivirga sp.]